MRMVVLCAAAMLLVSGCATTEKIQMGAQGVVAEQVDPQISKLKNQIAVMEMPYSQLEDQLADLKNAQAAAIEAQNAASGKMVADIKEIVGKAVRALDEKISALEAGMSQIKDDIADAAKTARAAQSAAQSASMQAEKAAKAAAAVPSAAPVR